MKMLLKSFELHRISKACKIDKVESACNCYYHSTNPGNTSAMKRNQSKAFIPQLQMNKAKPQFLPQKP